jgi:ribosome-binding protein aMBF1 (putative translation factor)
LADLDWWRELSVRFRELHERDVPTWAEWIEVLGTSERYTWALPGSRECSTRFEELAKLAAGRILPHAKDKLATWLTILKIEKSTASRSHYPEAKPGGRIDNICGVSAEYCLELERLSEPAIRRLSERIEACVSTMVRPAATAIQKASTPKRPNVLSVDEQAAIERCRDHVRTRHAPTTWAILFPSELPGQTPKNVPQTLSASLQVELRDYCCALFDCEAQKYKLHATDQATLQAWLDVVAVCIEREEFKAKRWRFEGLRYSTAECRALVTDGLKKKIDHWVKQKQTELAQLAAGPRREESSPIPSRSRGVFVAETSMKTVSERFDEAVTKPTNEGTPESLTQLRATARKAFVEPLLKKKGMTRSKLATKAGVDPSVVYDYLAGKSSPRPDNRNAIAEVLGIEESHLPD